MFVQSFFSKMEGGEGNIFMPTMQCSMLKSWSENIFKSSLICKLILPLDHTMIEPLLSYSFWKEEFLVSHAYFLFFFPTNCSRYEICVRRERNIVQWGGESKSQGRRSVLRTGRLFLFCQSDTVGQSDTQSLIYLPWWSAFLIQKLSKIL